MGLLVEYTVNEGMAGDQVAALRDFTDALRAEGCEGFSYTAYETDDPAKFIAVLDFDDDDAKARFLATAAFAAYRDRRFERARFIAENSIRVGDGQMGRVPPVDMAELNGRAIALMAEPI